MPQYDGSIRINTEISTKGVTSQMQKVVNQIQKAEGEVSRLQARMKELENTKIPTEEYKKLQRELAAAKKKMTEMLAQDSQFSGIEEKIKKLTKSASEYEAKLEDLFAKEIPTKNYSSALKEVEKLEAALLKAYNRKERFLETGGDETSRTFKAMQYDIEAIEIKLRQAERDAQDLVNSGKAFVLGKNTDEYKKLSEEYAAVNREIEKQETLQSKIAQKQAESVQKVAELKNQLNQLITSGKAFSLGTDSEEYAKTAEKIKELSKEIRASKKELAGLNAKKISLEFVQAFEKMRKSAKTALNSISKAFSTMKNITSKAFSAISSGSKKSSGLMSTFSSRIKGLALSLLVFNWISKGFNAMISGMKTGFGNFENYSNDFANSVQAMKNALSTLGNQIAAAFAPIIQAAIPYLVQLINWVTAAVNAIGQLFAALSGKKTWTKATEVQNGYNDALDQTASSAKKAYGALAKFDDLDVLQKNDDNSAGGGGTGGGGAAGGFEEVPISDDILNFAEKIKDILSKLFEPFLEAWNREGQFVMDSWKYALDEVWNLAKDIGRDFLIMWNQEKTIQMFADILHIVGDIGLVIGNIAHALDEAWNKNNTGLHILENIRDIFAVIVHKIREAADYTVIWSESLNFSPLLESIEQITGSLERFAGFASGTLLDFYMNFLLPLASWSLSESGLPRLLNILSSFIDEINWGALRLALRNLYQALEPYAEAVGNGLIDFFYDMKRIGVDFLNFLPMPIKELANAFKSGNPEDVRDWAEALLKFAIAVATLKIAFSGFEKVTKIISGLGKAISTIGSFFEYLSYFNPQAFVFLGSKLVDLVKGTFLDPFEWDNVIGDVLRYLAGVWERFWDGVLALMSSPIETFKSAVSTLFNLDWVFALLEEAKTNLLNAFNGKDIGENIVKGLFNGISAAIGFFLAPIVNLFTAIVEGICELLGIHSPSTVFYDIGYNLIEGLFLGIQETWNIIYEFFVEALTILLEFFSEIWQSISETAIEVWTAIFEFLSETWTYISEFASETWSNIKEFMSTTWANVKSKAEEIWNALKMFFSTTWTSIKTTATTIYTAIKTFLQTTWENVKAKTLELWTALKNWLTETWTNIKTTATTIYTAIKTFLQTTWEKVKEKAEEIWTAIKEWFFEIWTNIKEKAEEIWEKVREMFEEKMNAIREKVSEIIDKFNEFRQNVTEVFENIRSKIEETLGGAIGKISDFIDRIREAIEAVKDFLSSGWEKVSGFFGGGGSSGASVASYGAGTAAYSVEVPALASGAVIRGGNPFLAFLGDQPRGQTNIEAPISTIEQALENVMSRNGYGSNGCTAVINLQYDGQTFARVFLDDFLSEANRRGLDVSILGVT